MYSSDPARDGARDGAASVASFARPTGVALGPNASIFVADAGVRQIAADGSVTTLHLPLHTAIGISSSLRGGGTLFVTGSDGLWVIDLAMLAAGSQGAVSLLHPGMAAFVRPTPMPGVNALTAFGQHSVGVPFGVAAFPDGVGLVYTDVSTHTVRYANPATQSVDVIGGRDAGDAADESGAFAVADAGNKRIRLIRNVDRSAPDDAANGVFPDLGARNDAYRILFIGSSLVWDSGPFSRSPAAAIELASGRTARVRASLPCV